MVFVEALPVVSFEKSPVTVVEPDPATVPVPLLAEFVVFEAVVTEPVVRLPPVVFWLCVLLPVLAETLEAFVRAATFVTVTSPLMATLVELVFVELAPVRWFVDVLLALVVPAGLAMPDELLAELLIVLPAVTPPVRRLPAVVFCVWLLLPDVADKPNEFTAVAEFVSVISPVNEIAPEFVLLEENPVVSFINVPVSATLPWPISDAPILRTDPQLVAALIMPESSMPPVVFCV